MPVEQRVADLLAARVESERVVRHAGDLLLGDGKLVPTAAPDENGGGSDNDWIRADSSSFPSYVINKDGRVYKLVPGTADTLRAKNPNKWEWKNPTVPRCLSPLP
jgi:hypothetical protein